MKTSEPRGQRQRQRTPPRGGRPAIRVSRAARTAGRRGTARVGTARVVRPRSLRRRGRGRRFYIQADAVRCLDMLDESPCRVDAQAARRTHVIVGL